MNNYQKTPKFFLEFNIKGLFPNSWWYLDSLKSHKNDIQLFNIHNSNSSKHGACTIDSPTPLNLRASKNKQASQQQLLHHLPRIDINLPPPPAPNPTHTRRAASSAFNRRRSTAACVFLILFLSGGRALVIIVQTASAVSSSPAVAAAGRGGVRQVLFLQTARVRLCLYLEGEPMKIFSFSIRLWIKPLEQWLAQLCVGSSTIENLDVFECAYIRVFQLCKLPEFD